MLTALMPAPKALQKQRRAQNEMELLAAGQTVAQTAKAFGVSRKTVHRDLADPSNQALLGRVLGEHDDEVVSQYGLALKRTREAMNATQFVQTGCTEEGTPQYEQVPDHDTRLNGVRSYTTLAGLLFRHAPQEAETRTVTWEQFQVLLMQAETEQAALVATKPSSTSKTSSKRKRGGSTKPRSPTSRSTTSSSKANSDSSRRSTTTTKRKPARSRSKSTRSSPSGKQS